MTARQQIRVAGRRLGRDRSPIDATPAPSVGELLQAARQKKGVDLYRAERDTKIRARHLAALEGDDDSDLPGSVYTRGFLRNYALYLGLDPDEVISRWRAEQDPGKAAEVVVVAPPQPIIEPGRRLTFTPGLLIGAVLAVVVLLFAAYVGLQVVRFWQAVTVTLDGSATIQMPLGTQTVTLSGMTEPHATVNINDGVGAPVTTVSAGDDGRWSVDVPITSGRNDFSIVARDGATDRSSAPFLVVVNVPFPGASPTPSPVPGVVVPVGSEPPGSSAVTPAPGDPSAPPPATAAAQLTITKPADQTGVDGARLIIAGSTDAKGVRASAAYLGKGDKPADKAVAGGPKFDSVDVAVKGGDFTDTLALPAGWWALTVTTDASASLAATASTVTVDVSYNGLVVVVEARGGSAWMKVWVDGQVVDQGHTYRNHEARTFTAKRTVVVSTGNESSSFLTINGDPFGTLGSKATIGTWQIDKGKAPRALP